MLLDLTKWSQQRPKNWVGLGWFLKKIYQEPKKLDWVEKYSKPNQMVHSSKALTESYI